MGALERVPAIKAEVVSDPTMMSGDPVVKGTRILAETILGYLSADCSPQAIFEDYPSLPVDGIDAVARWAEQTYGADWKSAVPAANRLRQRFLIDECLTIAAYRETWMPR